VTGLSLLNKTASTDNEASSQVNRLAPFSSPVCGMYRKDTRNALTLSCSAGRLWPSHMHVVCMWSLTCMLYVCEHSYACCMYVLMHVACMWALTCMLYACQHWQRLISSGMCNTAFYCQLLRKVKPSLPHACPMLS